MGTTQDVNEIVVLLRELKSLLIGKFDLGLTEEEAAALLHVSPKFLYRARKNGVIGYSVLPSSGDTKPQIRYQISDITEFLKREKFRP